MKQRRQAVAYPDETISSHIWRTRYRTHGESTPQDSWCRVARAVAQAEAEREPSVEQSFFRLLESGRFYPGGRILAGAGSGRDVTLANCFVVPSFADDLGSVFSALRDSAEILRQGGGIGCDFSTLLPRGAAIEGRRAAAPGPVAFLRLWEEMCRALFSQGSRSGAMMANLRCDHPDVAQFVAAKSRPGALSHFNLSLLVSDAFLSAVENGEGWTLSHPRQSEGASPQGERRVSAQGLWQSIMRAAYESCEPGVLFIDRINRANNLHYCETISATNPCGEIPLPPGGACHLGSINLCAFVRDPFGANARIDDTGLRHSVRLAVRFLDDVIDVSTYPLPNQRRQALASRRMGLGLMGLGDCLVMLGQAYDSETARMSAERIMETIRHEAVTASIELAEARGEFPLFERDAFLEAPMIAKLPGALRDRIAARGIRNSHLTAIAPTGTISLLADAVSSGLEPVFAERIERAVRQADGTRRDFAYDPFSLRVWRNLGRSGLPPCFRTAQEISPRDHLLMQASLQRHVDNAISKTVPVARDCPFDEFSGIYRLADELDLKGCAVFRSGGDAGLRGVVRPAECLA